MNEPRSLLDGVTRGTHALGVALIGLGLLLVLAPALIGAPVVLAVGAVILLAGGILAAAGWGRWANGHGPFVVVTGALALACGLALVLNPVSSLEGLSALVAIYLVVDGVAGLLHAARLDVDAGRMWVLGDALLSIALGVSMWVGWPFSGLRALGLLLATKLVSAGAVVLRLERGMRRVGAAAATLRARFDD
jgi:uncharacterized membrane protein HdeD (DUF308 family)